MLTNNILIRKAGYQDIEQIAVLDSIVFHDNAWSAESFTKELDLHFSKLYVAEINNQFAGFVLGWFIAEEIQLLRIAVVPQFQRNKVGTSLIKYLISNAQNQKKIVLEVADSNKGAIMFYTSLGFHQVGFRKNYYHFDNAILMEMIICNEN